MLRPGKTPYFPESVLRGSGAGLGVGFTLLAGLDTPTLISKKPKPLRNESSTLIRYSFPTFAAGAEAVAAFPCRKDKATGGRGLSALASSRLTCHISVSESTPL